MPRFFFDVREGTRFAPDDEGLEFPDLDAAKRQRLWLLSAEIVSRKARPARLLLRSETNTASGF